ncbi:MAG: hypothetical protein RSA10_03915 [Bacilli bacterium]
MLKNVSKLAGLFLLLFLSFIYTDKVFGVARNNDPLMKEVLDYKEKNDIKPLNAVINGKEITLGYAGISIDAKRSYKSMKKDGGFDKDKIMYENSLPDTTISKTYDYYITGGNYNQKEIAIIFKVKDDTNVDSILKHVGKSRVKVTFFVEGTWLEENVETAFSMVNLGCDVYNLGYNGRYEKKNIGVTNNLISSITMKDANYCLNENKNEDYLKVCNRKQLHTIYPKIINPSIFELKKQLKSGSIISYDLNTFETNKFDLVIRSITSRGYTINSLSKVASEERN